MSDQSMQQQQNQGGNQQSSPQQTPSPPGTAGNQSLGTAQAQAQQQTTAPAPRLQSSAPVPSPPAAGQSSEQIPQEAGQKGSRGGERKNGKAPVTDYQKRSERFRKEREIIKAREVDVDLSKRLSALAVPFIFLAILTLIVVFIFIPFGTEIKETRDNTRALLKDIERNEEKIDKLMSIDLTTLDRHLEVTSTVIRDSMDVSEMAIEVERLALKHNLEPKSQKASNLEDVVMQASELDTEWVPSYADVVSGPYNYAGKFAEVTAFLKDLRLNSKTILSLGKIQMGRTSREADDDLETNEEDYWAVSLLISGYTAEPVQSVNVADPLRTELNLEVLQEIYTRAGEEFQFEVEEEEETTAEDAGEETAEDQTPEPESQ